MGNGKASSGSHIITVTENSKSVLFQEIIFFSYIWWTFFVMKCRVNYETITLKNNLLLNRFRPLGLTWEGGIMPSRCITCYWIQYLAHLPSQVVSYWRWPSGQNRSNYKKKNHCGIGSLFILHLIMNFHYIMKRTSFPIISVFDPS